MLPKEFTDRMLKMLGDEYPAFLACYESGQHHALRVNTLKADRAYLLEHLPFRLEPVPWCGTGFYYASHETPGKHPYHEAGLYYIQEPSAMAPAEYLMKGIQGDERILDLCAAPGGKSTQIAAAMQGRGVLVSNEIHSARAKILSENIERMGIRNALVTNETPRRLAEIFPGYFTGILVDAPCSGEGMFRKNEEACREWSLSNVELCAKRQDEILDCAASMLAPGGRLVYSTCTFAPAENEGSISRFLSGHPEFEIVQTDRFLGMTGGVAEWIKKPAEHIGDTVRLWPHRLRGEGHYLALLQKRDGRAGTDKSRISCSEKAGMSESERKKTGTGYTEYLKFAEETLHTPLSGVCLKFGGQLYLVPEGMPAIKGIKVLRPGLHLGTVKKNRFEPSHALALALSPEDVKRTVNFSAESREIAGYLKGETFAADGEKGWYLITVDGFGIGWGKLAGGIMKNHYPKGLRK